MYMHTAHTHTHTHTHIHIHIRMYMHTNIYTCTHTYIYTYACTCTKHIHRHKRVHIHIRMYMHTTRTHTPQPPTMRIHTHTIASQPDVHRRSSPSPSARPASPLSHRARIASESTEQQAPYSVGPQSPAAEGSSPGSVLIHTYKSTYIDTYMCISHIRFVDSIMVGNNAQIYIYIYIYILICHNIHNRTCMIGNNAQIYIYILIYIYIYTWREIRAFSTKMSYFGCTLDCEMHEKN
jgi:hypothetical protein